MNTILIIGIALVILNLVSFGLMGFDKHRAKAEKWRIPEKTLFIAAIYFGALGGVLGMSVFHHKTRHWYFRLFFPVLLVLQIALLVFGYERLMNL